MGEGKTYEIRSLSDFLKVPVDRRALCLTEFSAWLDLIETNNNDGIFRVREDRFRWIDDDKGELHASLFGVRLSTTKIEPDERTTANERGG